jgi:hypothetical protein
VIKPEILHKEIPGESGAAVHGPQWVEGIQSTGRIGQDHSLLPRDLVLDLGLSLCAVF